MGLKDCYKYDWELKEWMFYLPPNKKLKEAYTVWKLYQQGQPMPSRCSTELSVWTYRKPHYKYDRRTKHWYTNKYALPQINGYILYNVCSPRGLRYGSIEVWWRDDSQTWDWCYSYKNNNYTLT